MYRNEANNRMILTRVLWRDIIVISKINEKRRSKMVSIMTMIAKPKRYLFNGRFILCLDLCKRSFKNPSSRGYSREVEKVFIVRSITLSSLLWSHHFTLNERSEYRSYSLSHLKKIDYNFTCNKWYANTYGLCIL